MFAPPLMTLLRGEPAPTPFYQATRALSSDWFTASGPSALYVAALNKTIVAWPTVGVSGYKSVQVAAYDHATSTWSERYVAGNFLLANDDHGHPAIVQDADGYFYLFYGSHASPMNWSISTAANDISAWTQQTALTGAQTYPHPNRVGSVLYLMTRTEAVLTRCKWSIRTATPSSGFATFSAPTDLVDFDADSRCDAGEAIVVGTDIHFVATRCNAADTERKGVYYFVYDTVTGAVKNHNGSFSTASGSLPVSLTSANTNYRLFNHGSNQGEIPSLGFDTAGDPHVIFADGTGTTYSLKHIKRTSGTWSSPVTVDSLSDALAGSGFTTMYSLVPGVAGTVEAWYINSAGDKLRKVRSSSGTWGAKQTVLVAGSNELRSGQPVRNAAAAFRTIFCEVGTYPSSDSTAVLSKRYAFGDSGPIAAAVPMAAQDASFAGVVLLCGFESRDGAPLSINEADSSLSLTTNGNAQADTAQAKFGSASLLLDGAGDYLTVPDNALFKVTNGDFTIECWVRRNVSKLQAIASKRPNSGSSEYAFYIDAANRLLMQAFNTTVAVVNVTGTTALSSGVWYHVALSRQGTTWRMFLDGALEGSASESATPTASTAVFKIGRSEDVNTGRDFNGWIDEFRFTAGVARYTSAFTPPAAAFPRR